MNSIERIQYYSQKLEVEEPLLIDNDNDHTSNNSNNSNNSSTRIPLPVNDINDNGKTPTPSGAPGNTSRMVIKSVEDGTGTKMLPPAVALVRIANAMPPISWPSAGQVEFQGGAFTNYQHIL